ncbi:MAG: T9SS type A sorting domain-containing protein, partial [Bacteroidales bacterium]|nr:T9SS type A sorting domain-containing protein [Bacteroidales bacterium]
STASTTEAKTLADKIIIYPNPASDGFYVDGLESTATVSIVNIVGQQIITKQIENNEYVNISTLPAGMYLVKILHKGLSFEKKIIKDNN